MLKRLAAAAALTIYAVVSANALSVRNNDTKEQSFAVDTGASEAVYKVPAGASVEVKENCAQGCAVTGPWGYSRTAGSNDEIATDGKSLVTATAPVKVATIASPAKTTPAKAFASTKRKQSAKASKPKKVAKQKSGGPYFKGSFASLFAGKVN